ncbi:MAG: hypothetical protein HY363_05415 [Candidatus Aenigmarchaeota archaeon]|nr:hypothetical protein [Candidatus Aenigmarchaeota archaeon]
MEKVIFTYSTEHLAQKDKVRFYYALKGRDGISGIIVALNIEQLGKTVLLVNSDKESDVTEFLEFWKCEYQKKRVYLEQ